MAVTHRKENIMPAIPVNLKDIPEVDTLPKGEYVVKILEREERISAKGTVGDRWTLEVREASPYHGRRIWDTTYRTPESLWKLKRLCLAVGYKPMGEVEDEQLIGKVLKVSVDRKERDGRAFNEILAYKLASAEEVKAVASDTPF
jgi:hypothetical protein